MGKYGKSGGWILKLSRWAKFPWQLLQLATQAKSFEANYLIGNPKLNEMGLHVCRRSLADKLGSYRRRKLNALMTEAEKNNSPHRASLSGKMLYQNPNSRVCCKKLKHSEAQAGKCGKDVP